MSIYKLGGTVNIQIKSSSSPESEKLIRDFLPTCHSGVLATVDAGGKPQAATIYFTPKDDLSLVFVTKTDTQKYKNIKENNQVAFVCYDEKEQTTIQISGTTELITDPDEQQTAYNAAFNLSTRLSKREFPPIDKLYAGDFVALRLVPSVMRMAVYARPESEGYDSFETLMFTTK